MAYAYSTIQPGSGIIGNATGGSIVITPGAGNRFGIGAIVIIWPSGQPLDPDIHNYETVQIVDRVGDALTVTSPGSGSRLGLDTWAVGDQLALQFPAANVSARRETQVITIVADPGNGPTIDLGADAIGIVGLITATISNVNLDGGTSPFALDIGVQGSFDGVSWSSTVNGPSGSYDNFSSSLFRFVADDPAPLYAQRFVSRYLRFTYDWQGVLPGPNANATITFDLNYY